MKFAVKEIASLAGLEKDARSLLEHFCESVLDRKTKELCAERDKGVRHRSHRIHCLRTIGAKRKGKSLQAAVLEELQDSYYKAGGIEGKE